MVPSVTYALGQTFGGGGIGRIARNAAVGAYRANLLKKVITWESSNSQIPQELIISPKLGSFINRCPWYYPTDLTFDLYSLSQLDHPDIFHGWRNMSLRSIRRANRRGATTVVEGASTHPEVQKRLVENEYRKYSVNKKLMNKYHFSRAINELEESDYIFVPSEFVYNSFLENGFNEEKIILIPFGVNVDVFHPPEDYSRSDGEFLALFVGQISLRKGIQYLLPAWSEADIEGKLILAGKVTDTAADVVNQYRTDPTIEFRGWVNDMEKLYREASVFVFPSIEEGSALVSYEAMASGLPSIVTPNVGSLVEDGKHGIVVSPYDVAGIARAIERFAASPKDRARMGYNARKKIQRYTWKRYSDKVAQAYLDIG